MKSPERKGSLLPGTSPRIAVVISPYYEAIVMGMFNGAKAYLAEYDVTIAEVDIFTAPGAFEVPLIAQTLAQTGKFDGVICLGCVIKGETAHFEFLCVGTTMGIMNSSLATGVPISFGILTTYSLQQAEARSVAGYDNKGREAAFACLETVRTLRVIRGAA